MSPYLRVVGSVELRGRRLTDMLGAFAVLALLIAPVPSLAATWTGATSTDWLTAGNWSGGVPTSGVDGFINTTTNAPVISVAGATARGIYVGDTATGALTISGGGTLTSSNTSFIATNVGTSGLVTVTGAGSLLSLTVTNYIASLGDGTLTVTNAGQVSLGGNTYVAFNPGSTGRVTVDGSGSRLTSTAGFVLGNSGAGTLTIANAGQMSISGNINAAANAGSSTTATITGTGSVLTTAGYLWIGNYGSATFNVSDSGSVSSLSTLLVGMVTGSSGALNISQAGRVTSTAGVIVGSGAASVGTATVTGAGSVLSSTNEVRIGGAGAGTLLVSGGGTVSSGTSSVIGYNAGGNGAATVTGSGSRFASGATFHVGFSGAGALTVTDGAAVSAASTFSVGTNSGGNGALTVSNAGRVTSTGDSYIGNNAGATGTATINGSGSSWSSAGQFQIGRTGTGSLAVSNGGLVSSVATMTIAANAGSTGTLIIGSASGTAAVAAGTVSAPTISFGSGTGTLLFNHTESDYVFSRNITGSGSIVALAGVTSLTGNLSAFTGMTTVSSAASLFLSTSSYGGNMTIEDGGEAELVAAMAGDLILTGTSTAYLTSSGSIGGDVIIGDGSVFSDNGTVSGSVTVNDGGTLKGNGTISGDAGINAGATLAPGNSIGTLYVTGDVNFASGSTYEVEVNASGLSDETIATGNANITGGNVSVVPEVGGLYGVGTTYTFLTAAAINGTFDAVTLNTSSLFLDAALSYDATHAYATLTRNSTAFSSVADSPNQRSVAQALDSLPANNLFNVIAGQSSQAGTQAAYRALTGELHAGIKGSLLEEDDVSFQDRLLIPTTTDAIWARYYGNWTERNGDEGAGANTHAFTHKESGMAFGYDAPAQGWLRQHDLLDMIGVSFNYGRSDYDLASDANNRAVGDGEHYRLTAYGSKTMFENLVLRTSAQAGIHQIETDRTAVFTGYQDRLKAEYGAQTLRGEIEMAYKLDGLSKHLVMEPFARLNYGMTRIDGIDERGGNATLKADSDLSSEGTTTLGLSLTHNLQLTGRTFEQASQADVQEDAACNEGLFINSGTPCLLIHSRLGWKRLIGRANPRGVYSFVGSDSFVTQSAAAPRNAALINFGFDLPLTSRANVTLGYDAAISPEASVSSLRGGVSWTW